MALREAEIVAATSDDLRQEALLLAASAEEALGRPHAAATRLRSLFRDDPLPLIRWRLARAEALSGRPAAARRLARPLARASDPELAASARVGRAAWRLQRHRTVPAWRALGSALEAVEDGIVADVQADGHVRRLAFAVARAEDRPLVGSSQVQVRALKARLTWLEHADRDARHLVELRQPIPLLEGLVALGEGWRDLADALADAPPPRRLSPAQAAAYRQGLRARGRGLLARARDAFEAAIRVGEQQRLSARGELAGHLRISLAAIDARLAARPVLTDVNRKSGAPD